MRKHGWQLPYHPLQVVAVSVFLALGFAFYVFFAPFLGKKMHQYIVMGIYTPLIICVFGLYICCADADPADAGVFKSRKYCKTTYTKTYDVRKEGSKHESESTPSIQDANVANFIGKYPSKDRTSTETGTKDYKSSSLPSCLVDILALIPCALMCHSASPDEESSELQTSEDGMFHCSLCEVEVYKYSKHCTVCDKCVDRFDHHCRWLNNCIGKKNYKKFFALMVSVLLLLILQWSTGIVVLICLAVEHKKFTADIANKLGSSFTLPPYVIVVVVCIILTIITTLPVIQLFFFHVLLIKKGISTYVYIIALREREREQEHQGLGGPQSPQMSSASSITGFSSVSSFNTFRQEVWCTPPRLLVEDQRPAVSSIGNKTIDDPIKKKNATAVKISPWTLARLNADDVSKAAAEARKKSKILQPVSRKEIGSNMIERDMSFGRSDRWMSSSRLDDNQSQGSKRIYVPDIKKSSNNENDIMPLQHEPQSLFRAIGSSPESSLDSPDIQPIKVSSRENESGIHTNLVARSGLEKLEKKGNLSLTRSMSDGYDASGEEDSDRIPSRLVQRSGNTSARLFVADQDDKLARLKMPSSSKFSYPNDTKI